MNNGTGNTELPLVSIIVPVYNVEQYLAEAVNSLIHQTLQQIEILLIDDGSPDNCPAMCDEYAVRDKRIKVMHRKNGGYGKACNAGIQAARGIFFGILEPDDYVELNMYERLYNNAVSNQLDVVRCHYYYYHTQKNTHECITLSNIPNDKVFSPCEVPSVFTQQAPAIWAAIYKREFILKNNIFFLETPGAAFQDTSFAYKVYACVDKILFIEDALLHYRIDNNNSSSNSKKNVFSVCDEYAEIERFTGENILSTNWGSIIPEMKFLSYMWNYRRLGKRNNWMFLKRFSREMKAYLSRGKINKTNFTSKGIFKVYIIAFFYPIFHLLFSMKKSFIEVDD